ncbi:MAG: serine hydrolase [Verrucomicrobiales bacterium]|nr:serine hydrolase [Verrucomicrobiales bacterium]
METNITEPDFPVSKNLSDNLKGLGTVSSFIEENIKNESIMGAIALVARKGNIIHFESSGLADAEENKPMSLDSIFRVYSMTKPVTSVAVMMLVEEGKLELDEPISEHLSHFENVRVYSEDGNHAKPLNPITARHLLTHTSGLTYGLFGTHPVDSMYLEANIPMNIRTRNKTLSHDLPNFPLTGEPGSAWVYGLSTDVLGHLVEVISGKSLGTFFRERIFEPLGMGNSSFRIKEEKKSQFTVAYEWNEDGRTIADHPRTSISGDELTWESGGAGLLCPAQDYARFCQALLNGGILNSNRILEEKTVRDMTTNQLNGAMWPFYLGTAGHAATTPLGKNTSFGLGFRINEKEDPKCLNGSAGSYNWLGYATTMFQIDPEKELIMIGLTQKFPTDHDFIEGFKRSVYQGILEK